MIGRWLRLLARARPRPLDPPAPPTRSIRLLGAAQNVAVEVLDGLLLHGRPQGASKSVFHHLLESLDGFHQVWLKVLVLYFNRWYQPMPRERKFPTLPKLADSNAWFEPQSTANATLFKCMGVGGGGGLDDGKLSLAGELALRMVLVERVRPSLYTSGLHAGQAGELDF
jgi:hypothetical protein